jgi:hypothetical protein
MNKGCSTCSTFENESCNRNNRVNIGCTTCSTCSTEKSITRNGKSGIYKAGLMVSLVDGCDNTVLRRFAGQFPQWGDGLAGVLD